MLTALDLVLRLAPAVEPLEQSTKAISSFLGPPPNLPLHEACEFGSIALLDWIWSASCSRVADKTPWWSLTNFLRSDPNYHNWQFSRSLEVAAARGDLPMVRWLFEHFSGCEAPASVADQAVKKGYLHVMRFLWEHRSGNSRRGAGDQSNVLNGACSVCPVRGDAYWAAETLKNACENGLLGRYLDDGMQLEDQQRHDAIVYAVRIGNIELAQRLLPPGTSIFDYGSYCESVNTIGLMLDSGHLQRYEVLAASKMPMLARSGHVDLMQSVVQMHSPLPKNHKHWVCRFRPGLSPARSSPATGRQIPSSPTTRSVPRSS